jgi:uncharacterized membrane protein
MRARLSIIIFSLFYGIAGINHFINPDIYELLIPQWLGDASFLNYTAGMVEILIAIFILFHRTRKIAAWTTILMLLVFTISHVYFIMLGHCAGELCLPAWIGWLRLVIVHPLLIFWAYRLSQSKIKWI